MRISTIFTGGTIGSLVTKNGDIDVKENPTHRLIKRYKRFYKPSDIEFAETDACNILSENLDGRYLKRLVDCVGRELSNSDNDAIIVAHGTDTLQYTAAVLEYIYADSDKPILIVSSDYVLSDSRANGLMNFHCAIEFARKGGNGVYVSYCNKGGFPTIHRGTRLQNSMLYTADVTSVFNSWIAKMDGEIYFNAKYKVGSNAVLFQDRDNIAIDTVSKKILRIKPAVGMVYPKIDDDVKVILHESYHSGTIKINSDFKSFAKEAANRDIPFYITGLMSGEREYVTVREYKKYNVIPLYDKTTISQYCKLWLITSNDMDIRSMMAQCFGDEAYME